MRERTHKYIGAVGRPHTTSRHSFAQGDAYIAFVSAARTWLFTKVLRWQGRSRRQDFTEGSISLLQPGWDYVFPQLSLHHASGKKTTLTSYKVLVSLA